MTHTVTSWRRSPKTNVRSGAQMNRASRRKRGHEFTADNTFIDKQGWQVCLACRRSRGRIIDARRRRAKGIPERKKATAL